MLQWQHCQLECHLDLFKLSLVSFERGGDFCGPSSFQFGPIRVKVNSLQIPSKMSRKHNNPSADRNQGPILEVLHKVLDKSTPNLRLLEISSGTGQHSAYFAEHFPNITFQPSEYDMRMMPSIQAYAKDVSHGNVKNPICIDISNDCAQWSHAFEEASLDYMLNINMMHISPWRCAEGLFKNASRLLKSQGMLITYGPYAVDGQLAPESNVRFNASLRGENPEWGIRDLRDLKELGARVGIDLRETYDMPANNKTVIWIKS